MILLASTAAAQADGTMSLRGVYYKERSTRVIQPMLDAMFEVGANGLFAGHFLVDTITSASTSAGAEDAVPFTENRYEVGAGYARELGLVRIGFEGKYSTEPDYKSIYAGVRGELDLAQKNTVLGLGVGIGSDTISGGGSQGISQPMLQCDPEQTATSYDCMLTTYALFASVSQIVSRYAIASLTYDVAKLAGYQSNPYRTVLTDTGTPPERHPDERLRSAVAGSLRYYVARSQTAFIAAYRYYRDNWKIHAHTPELRIVQEVGLAADASVRYRYHTQDAAFFYQDRYGDPTMLAFMSDDVKLDAFTTHTIEAKLGVLGDSFELSGRWAAARFEGILEYILQHNRFGNAIIAHVALTVPFDD